MLNKYIKTLKGIHLKVGAHKEELELPRKPA